MQETLAIKSKEWMQPIPTKVSHAIQEVAKEQGFLFILNSQESIRNSRFLCYKNKANDITSLLKAKLE